MRGLGVALLWALIVVFVPSTAWSATEHCTATPPDPSCVEPTAEPTPTTSPEPTPTTSPEPTPTTSPEPTPTTSPEPTPTPEPAPGEDTGVYIDPATGNLRVDENTGVALGVAAWLAAVTAGLGSAWLVLP